MPSKTRGILDKRAGRGPQFADEYSDSHLGATAVAAAAVVVAGREGKDGSGGGSCTTDIDDTAVLARAGMSNQAKEKEVANAEATTGSGGEEESRRSSFELPPGVENGDAKPRQSRIKSPIRGNKETHRRSSFESPPGVGSGRATSRRSSFDVPSGGESKAVEVRNPLNAVLGCERHNPASRRRQFANTKMMSRVVHHLFGVEADDIDDNAIDVDDENGAITANQSYLYSFVLRRPWQRRVWRAMRNSHDLLSIFLGERKPGLGVSERLVLFLGHLQSQVMGVTLMFFLNTCYNLKSIFEENGMAVDQYVNARIAMLISATLFCIPVDLIVYTAFEVNQFRIRVNQDDTTRGSCCLVVCPRRHHGLIESKTCTRIRAFGFLVPWFIAASQVAICGAVCFE